MIAVAIVLLSFVWVAHFRGTGWTNAINPAYWYHRFHGDDLYNSDETVLHHGNRQVPEVALTFDDGPHPESRSVILSILADAGIHATFFDVGVNMIAHPELVTDTLRQGNEIGNHSQDHMHRLDDIAGKDRRREINDTDIIFNEITGKHLSLLRPPGMRYNTEVLQTTRNLGYLVVGYTTASRDFDPDESADIIAQRTLSRTENGSIILLHDYKATASALPKILSGLKQRGFRCVTIGEMIRHLPNAPRAAAVKQLDTLQN